LEYGLLIDSVSELKKKAAEEAVQYIKDGMVIGLGTGSTTQFAIRKIGELFTNNSLKDIVCIPSSQKTEAEARLIKIPLTTLQDKPVIDITIDGADEVDPQLNLIKGGGGALLREKILANASNRVVIIVDESKLSPRLGTKWPVPIEVIEFGYKPAINYLEGLGAKVKIRLDEKDDRFKTDEGNIILDCNFGPIKDVKKLDMDLNKQPAIVENGLFLDLATEVIVAGTKGIQILKKNN
jgi:ribose 5-phosphate isomerase A